MRVTEPKTCPCDWSVGENCPECYPGPDYANEPSYDDYPEDAEDAEEMRDE